MATLKEQIRADLTDAMRSRDKLTTGTLRMVLTSITAAEVEGKQARTLSDAEVVDVLTREQKRRREAAEAFAGAGRSEQAAAEVAEAGVIAGYLPQPLTDDEVATLVSEAVGQAQAAGQRGGRAMGMVMRQLKPATSGRVDGAALAAAVKRALGMG